MITTLDPAVIRVSVNLTTEIHDAETGATLDRFEVHNLVVNAGLDLVIAALNGTAITGVTHMATGTGATAIAAANTTLELEVTREAVTSKTISGQSLIVKYYLGSTVGNGNTLRKVGLFNAASVGTLIAAALLSTTIPKTSAIAATFTWTITLAAS